MADNKPSLESLPDIKPSLESLPDISSTPTSTDIKDILPPSYNTQNNNPAYNNYMRNFDLTPTTNSNGNAFGMPIPRIDREENIYDPHESTQVNDFSMKSVMDRSNSFFDIFKKSAEYAGDSNPDGTAETMLKSLGYGKVPAEYRNEDPLTSSTQPIVVDPLRQVWSRENAPTFDFNAVDNPLTSFISQTTDRINKNATELKESIDRAIETKKDEYAHNEGSFAVNEDTWGITKFLKNTFGHEATQGELDIQRLQAERNAKLADIETTKEKLKNIYADNYFQSTLIGNQKSASASKLYKVGDNKSLDAVKESTKFLKTIKDTPDDKVIDRYKNIGIVSSNIDNPTAIKANQIATKTANQKVGLFNYSDASNEENLYNGLMPELQALSNTINEDRKKMEEYKNGYEENFSEGALAKLKSEGKKLSPEGEKMMQDLGEAIPVFQESIKAKEEVRDKLLNIVKKHTNHYKDYLDNQKRITELSNQSGFLPRVEEQTIRAFEEVLGKGALHLTQMSEIMDDMNQSNKSPEAAYEFMGRGAEFGKNFGITQARVNAEKIFSKRQLDQTWQRFYNGKYTDISEIPAVQLFDKDGKFSPDGDWAALWYQSIKTGVESMVLAKTGSVAEAIGKKQFESYLKKSLAESELVAYLPAAERGLVRSAEYVKTLGLGFVAPSVMMYSPEMIRSEMLNKNLTFEQARVVGMMRAAGQGATEHMFLHELMMAKFLKGEIAPMKLAAITQDVAYKNAVIKGVEAEIGRPISSRLYGFIFDPLSKARIKAFGKGFIVVADEEGTEEVGNNVFDKLIDVFVKDKYKADYKSDPFTIQDQINTYIQTAATMLFQAGIGGAAKVREFNQVNNYTIDQSKYLVGSSPDTYRNSISKQLADGIISKEEASRRQEQVERNVSIYNSNSDTNKKIDDSKWTTLEKESMKNTLFVATLREHELGMIVAKNATEAEQLSSALQDAFDYKQRLIDHIDNYVSTPEETREKYRVANEVRLFENTYSNKFINGITTKDEVHTYIDKLTNQKTTETNPILQTKIQSAIDKLNIRLGQFNEAGEIVKPVVTTFESVIEDIKNMPPRVQQVYIDKKIDELIAKPDYKDEVDGVVINQLLDHKQKVADVIKKETDTSELENLSVGDVISVGGKEWTVKETFPDRITLSNQIEGGEEVTTISKDDLLGRVRTPVATVPVEEKTTVESLEKNILFLKQQLDKVPVGERQQVEDEIEYLEAELRDLKTIQEITPAREEGEHVITTNPDGGFDDDFDSPVKIGEVSFKNKEARDPMSPLEVNRTIGVNPTQENVNDPSLKTNQNVMASLLVKQEEAGGQEFSNLHGHGYSLLVLSSKDLINKLTKRSISTKAEVKSNRELLLKYFEVEKVDYWENNGLDQVDDKISVVVATNDFNGINRGDILLFNENGELATEGRAAYYPIPTLKSAEKEYDGFAVDKTGIKPAESLLRKGNNRLVYEATLEALKKVRKITDPVIYNIQKLSAGLRAKVTFTINRPSINKFIKDTDLDPATTTYYVATTDSPTTVLGAAYLQDRYGNNWILQRPKLLNTNWVNAIINMMLPNEAISKDAFATLKDLGYEDWDARYEYISKLIYLSDKADTSLGIQFYLTKDKKASIVKLNENYYNQVRGLDPNFSKLTEKVNPDGSKFYLLYMDKSYSKELLGMILRDQKKLNIVNSPAVGKFDIISFEGGKDTGKFFVDSVDSYNSYQDFVFDKFNVFAEPIATIPFLRSNGVQSLPGQYFVLDTENIDDDTKLPDQQTGTPSQDIDDNDLGLERSKKYSSEVTKEEAEAAEKWWASDSTKKLREYISLNKMLNIVNNSAFANFKNWTITLYNGSNPTDIFHEAWHGFSQMFLTKRQKRNLYNELRRKDGIVPTFYIKGIEYKGLKFSQLTDKQAEEVLGEDFRGYAKSNGKLSFGKEIAKQTMFEKMWGAIKEWITGNVSLDEYYRRLYKGTFDYTPSIDNQMFTSLDKSFGAIYKKNGQIFGKTLGSRQINDFVDAIDSIIATALQERGQSHILFSKDSTLVARNLARLYKFAHTQIGKKLELIDKNSEDYDDLLLLHSNFERFTKQVHGVQSYLFKNISVDYNLEEINEAERSDEKEDTHRIDSIDEITDEGVVDRDNMVSFADEGKYSSIERASNEIIFLIASLSKYVNGNVVKDRFGFNKLVSFDITWYRLATELKGVHDLDQVYAKIGVLGERYPEFKDLLKRLPDIGSPATDLRQVSLIQQFINDFSKPLVEMYEGILEKGENGLTFKNIKASTKATKAVKKIFSDLFKDIEDSKYVTKNEAGQNKLNVEELKKDFGVTFTDRDGNERIELTTDIDSRLKFLKAIGIDYSQITLDSIDFKNSIDPKKSIVKYGKDILNLVFRDLVYINEMGIEVTEPLDQVSSKFKTKIDKREYIHAGEAANIEKLLDLEVQATNEYFEDSAVNPNGDLVWQTQNYSKITLLYSDLNNSERFPTYQDLLKVPHYKYLDEQANPGIRNSLWLNSLFVLDEEGVNYGKRRLDDYKKPVQITLREIGGLKYREDTGVSRSAKTTDLSVFDKILYDFNSFVTNGLVEHMRYADKGSAKGTFIPKYKSSGTFLPVAISKFSSTKVPIAARQIFDLYLKREIEQIKQYNELEVLHPNSIKWYNTDNKSGSKFRIFDNILDEKTKDKLYKAISENLSTNEIAGLVDLTPHLESFFDRQVAELRNRLMKIPAVNGEGEDRNFYNEKLGIIESKVGVDYLHFLYAFTTNNYIYNIEQMSLLNGDIANYKKPVDVHKRLSADSATGTFAFMNHYVQGFLNTIGRGQADVLRAKGVVVKERKEDGTYNSAIFSDVIIRSQYIKAYLDEILVSANVDLTSDEILSLSVKDAQKLINSKASDLKDKTNILATILEKYSDITEGDGLGLCTLDFYRNFKILLGQWNDKADAAYHKAILGQRLSEDEMYYFVPMKAQYAGTIANTEATLGRFMRVDAFDKFALIPILPASVKGKPLEKFNDNLIKQGIDYGMFESGSKKASLVKDGEFNKFYQGDINNRTLNEGEYQINSKYFYFLKEQVYIEPKVKKEIIFATQFNKLFSVDLFEEGKSLSEGLGNLMTKYKNIRTQLINNEVAKLFKELHVTREGNDYKLENYEGIAKILQHEFELRDLPDNMRDFLKLDSENNLVFSLDASLSRQQINKILLSIVNNRLIKYKVNGDNYIQTAFTGWDVDDNLKIYEKKVGDDGKEYVTKMQVKISITKFKPLLNLVWEGKKIETRERLNALLKNEAFVKTHEQSLTMVGVRIPVQGANSMINGIVQEFLPEESGSLIVLPSEITAIAGSDFDIDKMSMYTPNFKKSGQLHKILTEADKKQIRNQMSAVYDELFEYIHLSTETGAGNYSYIDDRKLFKESVTHFMEQQEGYGLTHKERVEGLQQFIQTEILNFGTSNYDVKGDLMLFNAYVANVASEIDDLQDDLVNSTKYALQNELIKTTSEVLSLPEMFKSLITPNSNSILEPLADEMNNIFQYSRKMDYSKVLGYPEQLNQFEANLVGKATLGIAAVNNTFGQILKQHNVYLNNHYFVEERTTFGNKLVRKVPRIRLTHNITIVDGKVHISLAKIKDANGEHNISEVISQFINGYVDVARGAWVFWLGATYEAAPVMFYLNHAGVPIKENIYLLNQPIIRDYLRYKKFQKFIAGRAINEFYQTLYPSTIQEILFNKYTGSFDKTTITKLGLYSDKNADIFSEENLLKNVKEQKDVDKMTPEERQQQAAILAHYIELEEQAKLLRELMTALNFDTRKINSVFEAFDKNNALDKVKASKMFPEAQVDSIKKDSVISMLDMNPMVAGLYPKFYDVVESAKVNNYISNHIKDADFEKRDIFESRFKNDLVAFMFNMFGNELNVSVNNSAIFDKIAPQFQGGMVERLKGLKKEFPTLAKELPVLDLLVGDRSKISTLYNIKPKKTLKETIDVNSMIEDFKKGLSYTKRNAEDNLKIQNFFKDVIYFGFVQSGVGKSPISYTNILPTEEISRIITNAVPLMQKLIETDPNFLNTFYVEYFMKNNPLILKKAALKRAGLIINHGNGLVEYAYNREGFRFKPNPESLTKRSGAVLNPVKETVPQIQREYTPEKVTTLPENGVFVFGSNAEGIHGKGAALDAKTKFGARQGQAEGLQGQSYAIITKKNWRVEKSSTLAEIQAGIDKFLEFAYENPDKKFYVTKIGSSLAGYTEKQIANLFEDAERRIGISNNVILPKEFDPRDTKYSKQDDVNTPTTFDKANDLFKFLKEKTGITGEIINDAAIKWKGKLVNNFIPTINIAYANLSDGFHEYSHPLLMALKRDNPQAFINIYNTLTNTEEWETISKEAHKKVREKYPELKSIEDATEEVVATALGWAAANKYESFSTKFKNWLNNFFESLNNFFGREYGQTVTTTTMSKSTTFGEMVDYLTNPDIKIILPADWMDEYEDLTSQDLKDVIQEANNINIEAEFIPGLSDEDVRNMMEEDLPETISFYERSEREIAAEEALLEQEQRVADELQKKFLKETESFEERFAKGEDLTAEEAAVFNLREAIKNFRRLETSSEIPIELSRYMKLPKADYKPRAKGGTILYPNKGTKIPTTSKFTEILEKNPNGSTVLTKPFIQSNREEYKLVMGNDGFSIDVFKKHAGAKEWTPTTTSVTDVMSKYAKDEKLSEKEPNGGAIYYNESYEYTVLEEFRQQLIKEAEDFVRGTTRKPLEKIPNARVAEKWKIFMDTYYPFEYYEAIREGGEGEYPYGLAGGITEVGKRIPNKHGYEVVLSNGYLTDQAHTYNLKPAKGKKVLQGYNGLGWYIYYRIGDKTLIYEYQSDFTDGDNSIQGGENVDDMIQWKVESFERVMAKKLGFGANLSDLTHDMNIAKTELFKAEAKLEKVRNTIKNTKEGNVDNLSQWMSIYTDKQLKAISNMLERGINATTINGVFKRKLPKAVVMGMLKKFMGDEKFQEFENKIVIGGVITGQDEFGDVSTKDGKVKDSRLKAIKGAVDSSVVSFNFQQALREQRKAERTYNIAKNKVDRYNKINSNPKLLNHYTLWMEAMKARMRLYAHQNVQDNKAARVQTDIKRLNSSWFTKSIISSFLYAKQKGDEIVYLPTAQLMSSFGDATTPYVTPADLASQEQVALLDSHQFIPASFYTTNEIYTTRIPNSMLEYRMERIEEVVKLEKELKELNTRLLEKGLPTKEYENNENYQINGKDVSAEELLDYLKEHRYDNSIYSQTYSANNAAIHLVNINYITPEIALQEYNEILVNNNKKWKSLGGFYLALRKLKNIDFEITTIPEFKQPVIKVDISNFNTKAIERFSKLEEDEMYSQEDVNNSEELVGEEENNVSLQTDAVDTYEGVPASTRDLDSELDPNDIPINPLDVCGS